MQKLLNGHTRGRYLKEIVCPISCIDDVLREHLVLIIKLFVKSNWKTL